MRKIRSIFVLFLLILIQLDVASELALSLKWEKELRNPVTAVWIADLDGDGVKEIIAAVSEQTLAGGAGWIYVLDRNGEIKAESNVPGPPSDNLVVGDIDNDGKMEIILGIYSYLHVLDSNCSKRLQSRTGYQYRIMDVKTDDLDGDGIREIVVVAGIRSKNGIYVYNSNGSIKWASGTTGRPYSIAIHDLNNDGHKEVITATVGGRTDPMISYPAYVYVFDSSGEKEWSHRMEKGINFVAAADIDNDGRGEILAGSWPDLNAFNSEGNISWTYTTGGRINAISVADIDNDRNNEIIVASNDVYILDSKGELKCKNSAGSEVYTLAIEDIDKDGRAEIIAGSDRLYVIDSECNDVWNYRTGLSVKSVSIDDLDNDNYYEIVIGSADHNVYVLGSKEQVMGNSADDAYSEAQKLYLAGNYEDALNYAKDAKKFYKQLKDSNGVSKAELLTTQIEKAMEDKKNERAVADSYYGLAENFSISGDYLDASRYAKKARAKYSSLGEPELVSKCDSLLNKTDRMVALIADSLYNNGSRQYSEGEHMDAISTLDRAKEHYVWVKDTNGSRNCDRLLAETYYKLAKEQLGIGNLDEASLYSQRARAIYLCLEDERTTSCNVMNIQVEPIDGLLRRIENQTYEDSKYREELTELNSLMRDIASGGRGEEPVPGEYLDYLIIILVVLVIIVAIATVVVFMSKRKGKKKAKPKKKKEAKEPTKKKEKKTPRKMKFEEEPPRKEAEKEPLIKVGRPEDVIEEKPRPRKKIEKIKRDAYRGEGVSLSILSENE